MIVFLAAAALAIGNQADGILGETAHAIEAGRLMQARQMLAKAMGAGQSGPQVDQLLADLAFAERKWPEAQARYAELFNASPKDAHNAERAGIASLMNGQPDRARSFIEAAIALGKPSWRAWNALGIACDFQRDWDCADAAYATAGEESPDKAEVLNNHGWSLILRGEWASSVRVLEIAARASTGSSRIANNLELARAAVSADLPRRRRGESSVDFAARLNDAGVAAAQRGERERAIAALSRALAVSDSWYARAANNLARLQRQ